MDLRDRLGRLEERAREAKGGEEGRISQQALRRVTDEDLRLLHAYLKRAVEEGGELTDEERLALRRYEEIKEEVRNGN